VLVLSGIRRSSTVNTIIVLVSVGVLVTLAFSALPTFDPSRFAGSGAGDMRGVLEASALMFVA